MRLLTHFSISITKLTIIGFSAVILPLAITLIYAANQIHTISLKSGYEMNRVADVVSAHRQVGLTISQLQRLASQYVIVNDNKILALYQRNLAELNQQITTILLSFHQAEQQRILEKLLNSLVKLEQQLESDKAPQLSAIRTVFAEINVQFQHITSASELLVSQKIIELQNNASHTSNTILLSLLIIPFSFVIAIFAILMIVKPLNSASKQIKRLEKGDFSEKILPTGTKEVRNILIALDNMRGQLDHLELQKSSFIRHISHELKTPLAAIREGTELIYDHSVGQLNKDQQEITLIIRENVNRLQTLIEDLLDFNIVLDNTSQVTTEQIDLNHLVEQIVDAHKFDIQRLNLSITTDFKINQLVINHKQLTVIIDNLFSNALKYAPQASQISIESNVTNEFITITVCDQGAGISPERIDKVFDAFYQAEKPLNVTVKSSGLGLTIVKELVQRLHGKVTLTSLPTYQGVKATVYLPLEGTYE